MEMVDLIKADDLMEMVEASVMSEDPSFLLDIWEVGEEVRAVSQWEDETYQVSSSFTLVALPCPGYLVNICDNPNFTGTLVPLDIFCLS